jgi:UDP-3-O-[3-hydroxymyristoyl] glucosamine N-acyltransferase
MPDSRFFLTHASIALGDALRLAGVAAPVAADASSRLTRAAGIDEQSLDGAVVYVDGADKFARLAGKRFGLCFAPDGAASRAVAGGPVAAAQSPRAAFAAIAAALHSLRPISAAPRARVAADARIHPTAIIGDDAEIGAGALIGPYAMIGPGVVIGTGSEVAERVSIWCAVIGADCRIGAGSAIGGPGFGFEPGKDGLTRVPQLGRVIFGRDVEVGQNCCIDRGAFADTIVGDGTKFDNLVQIAHNVRLGRNCVVAAQVGIAGSAKIGDRVQFGGQAGIADHVAIGDDARIAAKAGIMRNVPAGETWGGYPARPMMTWMRETAMTASAARKKKARRHDD